MEKQLSSRKNPYIGPRAFGPDQKDYFFGREVEANTLVSLVATERLVLVYSQSGAGKSSLINTSLISGLEEKGFEILPIGSVKGEPPADISVKNIFLYNLMTSVVDDYPGSGQIFANLDLSIYLAGLNVTPEGDYFYDGDIEESDNKDGMKALTDTDEDDFEVWPRCLIIDQFEELFTSNTNAGEQQRTFFEALAEALKKDRHLWIVLSLRKEYIADLDPFAHIMPNRLQTRFYLQRLNKENSLHAITGPAKVEGRDFAPGIAEKIRDDLLRGDQFVEPVHLQIVCQQLWKRLSPDSKVISERDLRDFGDVDKALIDYYEGALELVKALPDLSEREVRKWFNDKLTTPMGTRRLLIQGINDEVEGLPYDAVKILEDAYIVRAETRGKQRFFELTHDRLIEPIQKANQRWREGYKNPIAKAFRNYKKEGMPKEKLLSNDELEKARKYAEEYPNDVFPEERAFLDESIRHEEDRQLEREERNPISRPFREWQESGQMKDRLLDGSRLKLAETYAREYPEDILLEEREFLDRSKHSERNRRIVVILGFFTVLSVIVIMVVSLIIGQQTIKKAQQTATSIQKAADRAKAEATQAGGELAQAQTRLTALPPEIASQNFARMAIDQFNDEHYRLALLLAVESTNQLLYSLDSGVAINEDMRKKAVDNLTLTLSAKDILQQTFQHDEPITEFSWNSAGTLVSTVDVSGTVRIWDTETGIHLQTWNQGPGVIQADWNPQGTNILAISRAGIAEIWDISSGTKIHTFPYDANINASHWSPDGTRILTEYDDGKVIVWDTKDGKKEIFSPPDGEKGIGADWSPDSIRFLTINCPTTQPSSLNPTSNPKTPCRTHIWDSERRKLLYTINHKKSVKRVYWLRGGNNNGRILTWADDNSIQVWNIETGEDLGIFPKDNSFIKVQLNKDKTRLLTAEADGTVKVWNVLTGESTFTDKQNEGIIQASWNPQETSFLTISSNGVVTVLGTNTGDKPFHLSITDVDKAGWDPGGNRIFTITKDGLVQSWAIFPGGVSSVTQLDDLRVLRDEACSRIAFNLDFAEWQTYLKYVKPPTDQPKYQPTCEDKPVPPSVIEKYVKEGKGNDELFRLLATWEKREVKEALVKRRVANALMNVAMEPSTNNTGFLERAKNLDKNLVIRRAFDITKVAAAACMNLTEQYEFETARACSLAVDVAIITEDRKLNQDLCQKGLINEQYFYIVESSCNYISITFGMTETGKLEAGGEDVWIYKGQEDQTVTIAMYGEGASQLDTYLEVLGPDEESLTSDDDSGGNRSALIRAFRLPSTGLYQIVARGYDETVTGTYNLFIGSEEDYYTPRINEFNNLVLYRDPSRIFSMKMPELFVPRDDWNFNLIEGEIYTKTFIAKSLIDGGIIASFSILDTPLADDEWPGDFENYFKEIKNNLGIDDSFKIVNPRENNNGLHKTRFELANEETNVWIEIEEVDGNLRVLLLYYSDPGQNDSGPIQNERYTNTLIKSFESFEWDPNTLDEFSQ